MLPPILMALHRGLPQQAPGSDAATLRALALASDATALSGAAATSKAARILDIGCGPGRQTLALARATRARITAIDLLPEYLTELESRAERAGVADRIETRVMSMDSISLEPGTFDLVWSEGAIYLMGFDAGLAAWKTWLRPAGRLVVSELCWLGADRPSAAATFWSEAYPAMRTVEENLARARAAGYRALGHFTLEPEDWWTDYYAIIEARLPALEARHAGDSGALALLADSRAEIDVWRAHACGSLRCYGYEFFVLEALASE